MAPITKTTNASSSKTRSSSQMHIKKVKGENFYRNAKAVNRLKMLNSGKPTYDRDGKIVKAAAFQKGEEETSMGRVQPDRRWFGTILNSFAMSLF
jgi:nuclear GTP-binding protein